MQSVNVEESVSNDCSRLSLKDKSNSSVAAVTKRRRRSVRGRKSVSAFALAEDSVKENSESNEVTKNLKNALSELDKQLTEFTEYEKQLVNEIAEWNEYREMVNKIGESEEKLAQEIGKVSKERMEAVKNKYFGEMYCRISPRQLLNQFLSRKQSDAQKLREQKRSIDEDISKIKLKIQQLRDIEAEQDSLLCAESIESIEQKILECDNELKKIYIWFESQGKTDVFLSLLESEQYDKIDSFRTQK